jgi:hypothetical protein
MLVGGGSWSKVAGSGKNGSGCMCSRSEKGLEVLLRVELQVTATIYSSLDSLPYK